VDEQSALAADVTYGCSRDAPLEDCAGLEVYAHLYRPTDQAVLQVFVLACGRE
jgi:hypothetical protein